jgi:hypothetical protein
MILFRSLTEKPETGPGGGCLIGDRSWNAQLYLRAGSEFTPDRQFRSDLFGALVDSWQAPVPGTSAVFNQRLGQCPFHRRESVDAEIRHR